MGGSFQTLIATACAGGSVQHVLSATGGDLGFNQHCGVADRRSYMKRLLSPDKVAGLLSLLAALVFLPMWHIILYKAPAAGMSANESAVSSLEFFFSHENPTRLMFVWLAALPFSWVVIGTAYLFNFARSKAVAIALLALSAGLGIATLFSMDFVFSFFVVLPTYWGYRCVNRV